MKELAERLENVRYRPVVMDKDTPQIRPLARGAKIDALYLSNTLHYLHWTDKEIQNYKQKHNETPTDFAGRAVNAGTCDQVCRNLRAITADTARIIRFDKYNLRGAGLADFDCTFPFTSCDPAKIKIPGPLDPAGLMPDTI